MYGNPLPTLEHFNSMVNLLALANFLDEAFRLIDDYEMLFRKLCLLTAAPMVPSSWLHSLRLN